MQSLPAETDVLIVGAGPTGLTLANLLGVFGVRALVLETRATTSDLPRAIVVDDEGARTLQACGMAEAALAHGLVGEGSQYEASDGRVIASVGRGPVEFGFPKRNFIHQPELERALRQGVSRWPRIEVRFSATLKSFSSSDDEVTASIEYGGRLQAVRAKWLVACDGGRSPIREALAIPFSGSTYSQDWLVLDLARDRKSGAYSRFICDPARPTVVIPSPSGRRYEFMLLPGESREQATHPDFIAELLAPHQVYDPDEVTRAVVYTFHARIAERWRERRVLLAGDAAHLTPPFAGQGMNAGLRDAGNLAWKLAAACNGTATAGLLDSYDTERRAPCLAMIELAVLMGRVVMPRTPEEAVLQSAIGVLTEGAPALRQYLYEMRFKPRPYYAAGALVRDEPDVPASLVGHMIPQPVVGSPVEPVRLDEVLGPGFAIIGQGAMVPDLGHPPHPLWSALSPRLVHLWPTVETPKGVVAISCDDPVAQPLRAHRDQLLLIRPDRYAAGAFAPEAAGRFADAFQHVLRPPAPGSSATPTVHQLLGV